MYKGKGFRSTDANYTYTTNARRCSNSCNRIVLHSRIIHQGVNESFLVVLLCFLRILHCPSTLDQFKHGCPDLSFGVAVCRFVCLSLRRGEAVALEGLAAYKCEVLFLVILCCLPINFTSRVLDNTSQNDAGSSQGRYSLQYS